MKEAWPLHSHSLTSESVTYERERQGGREREKEKSINPPRYSPLGSLDLTDALHRRDARFTGRRPGGK